MKLGAAAGAFAGGVLPWGVSASPAAAAEDEYASATWEFTPGNGSGSTCTLFAESRVANTIDGRVALVHFQTDDPDPGCTPSLVLLELTYRDVHGNLQRAQADGNRAPTEVWLRVYNVPETDDDVVADVFVGYQGCTQTPGACVTSRELQPK